MLHIVVARHGPETCPAAVPGLKDKALSGMQRMNEVAKKLGINLKGGWTNMPGHIIYMVCDAPNAHVVNQMVVELQLSDWNTVNVSPIITLEETLARLQEKR